MQKNIKEKLVLSMFMLSTITGGLFAATTAFAQNVSSGAPGTPSGTHAWVSGASGGQRPAVFGTVTSVNGDTLTVTSKAFMRPMKPGTTTTTPAPTPTTYTVDATNATVTKANVASTVGSIAVGDTVVVMGTVSGTNVTATSIRDGVVPMMGMRGGQGMKGGMGGHASSTPPVVIPGNGQPVIGGTVASVSGDTLSVTTASGGVTYSVDATNAIVVKGNATSTVSAITTGDRVIVQGSVSGTTVSAYSVTDSGAAPAAGTTGPKGFGGKIFGAIGGFFKHMFGFF